MSGNNRKPRVAIIGAGIAGSSLAAEISNRTRTVLFETEDRPGFHSTGRSAALYTTGYGPKAVRALSRASEAFFQNPGSFCETKLLRYRGLLFPGRQDQKGALEEVYAELLADGHRASLIGSGEAKKYFPLLREDYALGAVWYPDAWDIDVDALQSGYLRQFKKNGGLLETSKKVTGLVHENGSWIVQTQSSEQYFDMVVNAAGAWADEVMDLAGGQRVGLVPKKRTVATVRVAQEFDLYKHSMMVDVDEEFYAKPEAGHLLISPADETPVEPSDVYAEELDIALAAERIEKALEISIRRIEHSWAGLRTFVKDKCPVVGFDPKLNGFFWLAGQGGYGIQMAPALARLGASLLLDEPVPHDLLEHAINPAEISPVRFFNNN